MSHILDIAVLMSITENVEIFTCVKIVISYYVLFFPFFEALGCDCERGLLRPLLLTDLLVD